MGQRYEKSKKNVSENKKTLERLHSDKDTLQNEYAPLSLLDSIQSLLDDETTDAIQVVRNVGEIESQRIESETDTAEEEKKQITGEINGEIAKLNAGLEKLRKSGNIEFGKRAVEQSSQEYKKQIDKFKSLIGELGEHASDIGAAGMGSVEGISGVVAENTSDTPVPLNEGEAVFIPHYNTSDLSPQALYASGSGEYTAMIDSLVASNVDYRPIEQFNEMRTQEDIDRNAMNHILEGHCPNSIQFVDGWTGKGAIQNELIMAMRDFPGVSPGLAVLSDPAYIAEKCGTHDDFLIASSCLNSVVSGLISRTFYRSDIIGEMDYADFKLF